MSLGLTMTSEKSQIYWVSSSCHQSYRIGWTFIDPNPFLDSSLLYPLYN